MSNALAIATVMGALSTRVQGLLNEAGLTGFEVNTGHPRLNAGSGVYMALYQIMLNASLRNLDLPTWSGFGEARQRPVLPLTLRILFSFVGDADALEPERLAGLVLSDLHARPIVGPDEIAAYLATLASSHPLRPSDLAQQPEHVKLSPVPLDSEELSRIWGLFGQNSFALSMAWEATAVLLDGTLVPAPGLPVASVGLAVVPSEAARLSAVYAEATRQPVAELGDTLIVEGSGLLSGPSALRVGTALRTLAPVDMTGGRLRLTLSSVPELRAGVQPVTVEHSVVVPGAAGDGVRSGSVSNALGLMVRPVLGTISQAAGPGDGRTVTIATDPVILADQRAELVLDGPTGRRAARQFTRNGAAIAFVFPDLPAGTYMVRLTIDGAANLPVMTGGVYSGPTVTIP